MILVADSGSTKCDWVLADGGENQSTGTMGFNPFFHSTEKISEEIGKNELLNSMANRIHAVYFYGAGCSSPERNEIVQKALRIRFPLAQDILVDHDLTAAAIATGGSDPVIACILGTGSNSCYFDGQNIREEVPALGYILGDEGSGAYFGKILLREFLYKRLPSPLQEQFGERYSLAKESILKAVYRDPNPNVYMAGFMRFVSDNREHPYFKEMLYRGLTDFANAHILCFPEYCDVPVSFVGSIAHYFNSILAEVAEDMNFTIGTIIKKPIHNLVAFHSRPQT